MKRYFGDVKDWADLNAVYYEGEGPAKDGWKDEHVLWAYEGAECYEGYLQVILEKDGELLEVESSHCSCNGHDFSPCSVTWGALLLRDGPSYGDDEAKAAWTKLVHSRTVDLLDENAKSVLTAVKAKHGEEMAELDRLRRTTIEKKDEVIAQLKLEERNMVAEIARLMALVPAGHMLMPKGTPIAAHLDDKGGLHLFVGALGKR